MPTPHTAAAAPTAPAVPRAARAVRASGPLGTQHFFAVYATSIAVLREATVPAGGLVPVAVG